MSDGPFLELRGVCKGYGKGAARSEVLADIDLSVARGELVCVVGYSGAGKTTLVSLMAGLTTPDRGTITLAGKPVKGPSAERGVVFQNYSLLPWLTAFENVYLAVDQRFADWPKARKREHAEKHLALVNLAAARDKRPSELSGGMRQRVALARTLAVDPSVLLLDEPFSAVDAQTRMVLQRDLARTLKQAGKTALLITHDLAEAVLMADRVLVMSPRPGRIIDEIKIDMPHRDDPIARREDERLGEYAATLMHRLHIGEAAAVEPAA